VGHGRPPQAIQVGFLQATLLRQRLISNRWILRRPDLSLDLLSDTQNIFLFKRLMP
jgi:hypothetical protein